MARLGDDAADWVEAHTDVQLEQWQRDFLDAFYLADPPSTTD